ncbi:MAG: nucleoside triphosphate pyrophosphatase [Kiloniellales bacterium]|jgi:septum formation protein
MAAAQPAPSRPQAPLILASASPRRLELLRQAGIEPQAVAPAEIDEAPKRTELPAHYARRMAREKAAAAAPDHPGAFILAADTVVALGRRILPKPADEKAARACLERLSGRRHRVLGGVVVLAPDGRRAERLVTTLVAFKRLGPREVAAYLASGEWQGKAGGYAIQGRAGAFVPRINGSYSNVVGLPLSETLALLAGLGFPMPDGAR